MANGSHAVWVAYPGEKLVEIHTVAGSREISGDALIGDDLSPEFAQPVSAFF